MVDADKKCRVRKVKLSRIRHRRRHSHRSFNNISIIKNQNSSSKVSDSKLIVEDVNSVVLTSHISTQARKPLTIRTINGYDSSFQIPPETNDRKTPTIESIHLQQLDLNSTADNIPKYQATLDEFEQNGPTKEMLSSSSFFQQPSILWNPTVLPDIRNKCTTKQNISRESLFSPKIHKYFVDEEDKSNKKRKRRRRRGCWIFNCCCCSPICCLIVGVLSALILSSLAALIGFMIIRTSRISMSTTTSTSTSSTTSTTTSATTTTTTTTTSSTTTSTTTSSTSSSTTSSTSTSSTSSTSTSTTSQTSTSTTSQTTTTITTTSATTTTATTTTVTSTTATAATTVTITSNTCTSGWTGVTILYHCDNCPDITPYTQYTYTYQAISTQTRIAFSFREDTGCFALDTVSVRSTAAPGVELIANNGFETGSLSSWTYCCPSTAISYALVQDNSGSAHNMGYTYYSQSGNYFYFIGTKGRNDYLYQVFPTTIGQTYVISYWLYNIGTGSASSADVIISV